LYLCVAFLTLSQQSMTNPFEDENGEYLVLVNHERQYSLWPAVQEIPLGWTVARSKGKRQECLEWVDANWTDMRPKSLVEAMEKRTGNRPTP
jgi:MbtH protein